MIGALSEVCTRHPVSEALLTWDWSDVLVTLVPEQHGAQRKCWMDSWNRSQEAGSGHGCI
jgi:hypothetical protein